MEPAYAKVNDYTATFIKREMVDGRLLPEEHISFKFKRPLKVYMKWLEGPHEGREALFVKGKNEDKVAGHESGLFSFITLNMDPKGRTAMRGNRHPITDAGIGRLIDIVKDNIDRAAKEGVLKPTYAGVEDVYGRQTYHIHAELSPGRDKGYYCRAMDIWVDRDLGLPIKITVHGWDGEVLEAYGYKDLKINAGLSDEEFDKSYKDYRF